jgi:hypothetical protein
MEKVRRERARRMAEEMGKAEELVRGMVGELVGRKVIV